MSNKIEYIAIGMLTPHPDNPRKDVGDVTELAASIRRSGVLQNLTVVSVPDEDGYTKEYRVVIGHRRLAAAQLAGLDELPCVVSDMDYRTQLATMLSENMQRADLTLVEQVEGIQLMLDLGESVAAVSELTGLSESTVRRRAKLAELQLPREAFARSAARGARLEDYAKLEQLSDPAHREKALATIGSESFPRTFDDLLSKERWEARKQEIVKILDAYAERVDCYDDIPADCRSYAGSYTGWTTELPPTAPEHEGQRYYYIIRDGTGHAISVYRERCASGDDPELAARQEREAKRRERRDALEQLRKQAYARRREFVLGMSEAAASRHTDKLIRGCAVGVLLESSLLPDEYLEDYLDLDSLDNSLDAHLSVAAVEPARLLLLTWYALSGDSEYESYVAHYGEARRRNNDALDNIYDMLIAMGYEPTADEAALRDGTHELFEAVE